MRLDTRRLQTLDQVREFLAGSRPLDLRLQTRAEACAFAAETLQRFDYPRRPRRSTAETPGQGRPTNDPD